MNIVKSNDIKEWYNFLNSIRNKKNIELELLQVPDLSKSLVTDNSINDLISEIELLKKVSWFNNYATWLNSPSVKYPGDIIKASIFQYIDKQLENLNLICANYSVENKTTSENDISNKTNSKTENATTAGCYVTGNGNKGSYQAVTACGSDKAKCDNVQGCIVENSDNTSFSCGPYNSTETDIATPSNSNTGQSTTANNTVIFSNSTVNQDYSVISGEPIIKNNNIVKG